MDEMHGEGVVPGKITRIDTNDQSGHWERIKTFWAYSVPISRPAATRLMPKPASAW